MNTKQGDGDGQIEAIFEEVLARVIFDTAIDIHKQTQISGASNIDTRPVAVDEASRVHEMGTVVMVTRLVIIIGLKFSEDIYGNTKNMATHAITCDRCGRQVSVRTVMMVVVVMR